MNKTDFEKLGFQDGVNDHDCGQSDLSLTAATNDYGSFYLEGYKKGYEIAATKSWYMVSYIKGTRKINGYFIDLGEKGNEWTTDKEKATKFPTRDAVYKRLELFSCGRGEYGFSWE